MATEAEYHVSKTLPLPTKAIGNEQGTLVAISGQTTRPETVGLPNSRIFETFEVPPGHSRAYEA